MEATILHIGDDLCRRIPVMETAGFVVFQSEVNLKAIHIAFDREEDYLVVVFHNDVAAAPEDAVRETRSLTEAPFVLFQNASVACEDREFDLVIPSLTPPDVWLPKLRELLQVSREIRERSAQLRKDCADVRAKSHSRRQKSSRNRIPPIVPDALWRGSDGDGLPDAKPPEAARPRKLGEKAV